MRKVKAKAKAGKARTCDADANAGEQWCVDFGRYVDAAVMLMVESEVRRHYTAFSAADLKARTEEVVHKCQTQVDSAFDCMLNSHGGTVMNDAQLLTSFCWDFVWSPSQSIAQEGKTIKTWSKMKVILDGIEVEKYKGAAEVASCDSDATTASNDETTQVTAVTRATPAKPRERSELEVLGGDLQACAFSASFLEKFEVVLAGVLIVQRKPIVLQPVFRELMNQVYSRA